MEKRQQISTDTDAHKGSIISFADNVQHEAAGVQSARSDWIWNLTQ
jgi:hypothetical protein